MRKPLPVREKENGDGGSRTPDLCVVNAPLSPSLTGATVLRCNDLGRETHFPAVKVLTGGVRRV